MSSILDFFISAIMEVFWRIGAVLKNVSGRPLGETGAGEESLGGLIVIAVVIGTLILQ